MDEKYWVVATISIGDKREYVMSEHQMTRQQALYHLGMGEYELDLPEFRFYCDGILVTDVELFESQKDAMQFVEERERAEHDKNEYIRRLERENAQMRRDLKTLADLSKPTHPMYERGRPVCRNCGSILQWVADDGYEYKADICYCCGLEVDWKESSRDE